MLMPATSDSAELTSAAQAFARMINRCGGIGGRQFDLHVVAETGDPNADCLDATTRFHPLVVASLAVAPAQRCIVQTQRTILVSDSDASNADLAASSGRLVATGSAEGTVRARLLDLVSSGRLGGRTVAIAAGKSPSDVQFLRTARGVLAASSIRLVGLPRASAVLVPMLDVTTVPQLVATARRPRHQPLDVYSFSGATDDALQQVDHVAGGHPAQLLNSANLFAFAGVADWSYRASLAPNAFSDMCNQAYASAAPKSPSSTTARPTDAPLSATYLHVADVCLLLRIVARGLFAAGVDVNQMKLATALHRLPYIDLAAPSGTPKPRPNQVVTEAVKRIEQVVVLTQVEASCPTSASSTRIGGSLCWVPVPGWDDGGRVVNVPLTSAVRAVSG